MPGTCLMDRPGPTQPSVTLASAIAMSVRPSATAEPTSRIVSSPKALKTLSPKGGLKRVPSFSARPGFPRGLQVLVVDEDVKARESAEALLKECQYQVTACGSAADAVTTLSQSCILFDVVLADAKILSVKPSGIKKLIKATKRLPFILTSDQPSQDEVMLSIRLGAVDFLEKPLSPLKLRNIWQHTVRKMMSEMGLQCLPKNEGNLQELQNDQDISLPTSPSAGTPENAEVDSPLINSPGMLGSSTSPCDNDDMEAFLSEDSAGTATVCALGSLQTLSPEEGFLDGVNVTKGLHLLPSDGSALPSPGVQSSATAGDSLARQDSGCADLKHSSSKRSCRAREISSSVNIQNRPPLAIKPPGSSCGTPTGSNPSTPQPGQAPPAPQWPTPGGQLAPGMVWGMPMNPLHQAPGIVPPMMMPPPPMPFPPMPMMAGPMCPPIMPGMPAMPFAPRPMFPHMHPFAACASVAVAAAAVVGQQSTKPSASSSSSLNSMVSDRTTGTVLPPPNPCLVAPPPSASQCGSGTSASIDDLPADFPFPQEGFEADDLVAGCELPCNDGSIPSSRAAAGATPAKSTFGCWPLDDASFNFDIGGVESACELPPWDTLLSDEDDETAAFGDLMPLGLNLRKSASLLDMITESLCPVLPNFS